MGIDPPEEVTPNRELEEGERRMGWGVWEGDLYGRGPVLGGKRRGRGWVEGEGEGYVDVGVSDEGVRGLLEWRGGETGVEVFGARLPWDELEGCGEMMRGGYGRGF